MGLTLLSDPLILEAAIPMPRQKPHALVKAYLETLPRPFRTTGVADFRIEAERGGKFRSLVGNPDLDALYVGAVVTLHPTPEEELQVRLTYNFATPYWATEEEIRALKEEMDGLIDYMESFA